MPPQHDVTYYENNTEAKSPYRQAAESNIVTDSAGRIIFGGGKVVDAHAHGSPNTEDGEKGGA